MAIETRGTHDTTTRPTGRARTTLVLLAAATFVVMTTETLPVGLLPQMAEAFSVSRGQLGLLVSVYGVVVVVGAIPLSILIARVPSRPAMLVVLALFVISIGLTAISSELPTALGARIVGGFAHAVFYSCSFTLATSVVPAVWKGRAIAIVGSGNALALALGVPGATALGAAFGWRVPFWCSAALLVVILVALAVAYRPLPESAAGGVSSPRALLRGVRSWPLLRVAITIVLVMGAHFLTYTYISPILVDAGVPVGMVSIALAAYGLAGVLGLGVAGRLADSRPRFLLLVTVAVAFVALILLFVGRTSLPAAIAALVLWGAAFGAAPVLWQLMAVRAAPEAASVGPAVVNSAFNVGISLGALGGGALLAVLTPGALAMPSAALVVTALLLMLRHRWLPDD